VKNQDELVVYWANFGSLDRLQRTNLFVEPPIRIMNSFHKESGNSTNSASYKACSGAKNLFFNTFVLKSPFDVDAEIIGEHPNVMIQEQHQLLNLRNPTYEKAHSVDYDFHWIFFCEESVEMVQTPPFAHKVISSDYGIIASGSYDISKWFRSINATYNLHKGIDKFKVKKDEPIFYIDFRTKKRVILKQFDLSPDLHRLAFAASEIKNFFPFETLEVLYNRFLRSKRHKKVMKEIQQNLLDD
jgi:hypothetical protein